MNPEPARHEIHTLNDIYTAVTIDNCESLANDLGDFVRHLAISKTGMEFIKAEENPNIKFTWIDDGKRECKTTISSTNQPELGSIEIKSKPHKYTQIGWVSNYGVVPGGMDVDPHEN